MNDQAGVTELNARQDNYKKNVRHRARSEYIPRIINTHNII